MQVQAGNPFGGEINYEDLGDDIKDWKLLETLNPSATTSITTAALPAHERYKIIFETLIGANGALNMQLNGDSATNYFNFHWSNITPTYTLNDTSMFLGYLQSNVNGVSEINIEGTTGSGSVLMGYIQSANAAPSAGRIRGIACQWLGGASTQITTMTFVSGVNMTGTIKIYGSS